MLFNQENFQKHVRSQEECASYIANDDVVFISPIQGAPIELVKAIVKRDAELSNVHLWSALLLYPFDFLNPELLTNFTYHSIFMGPLERKASDAGLIDSTSFSYGYLAESFASFIRPNVLVAEVSLPDEDGNVCFGPTGGTINHAALQTAEKIILQINPNVPYIYGERNKINLSEAIAFSYSETPLITMPVPELNETDNKIAELILNEVKDGSTIQLGIGALSEAIGFKLTEKKELGIHTEMFSDGMMALMKNGAVTNQEKQTDKGYSVIGFALGSADLYRYLDHNEDIRQYPINEVNLPTNISKNDKVVSINSCINIDLTGQIAAEGIGFRQISGIGGALDFVKGANYSKGGQAFTALPSTTKTRNGLISNIVLNLPVGTVVSVPRSEARTIVTEFGAVNLQELSLRERTAALISIAHPDFRDELTQSAIQHGLLPH